jgi:Arc/MetJ-type ribon-helix-helix transcriptional regulator
MTVGNGDKIISLVMPERLLERIDLAARDAYMSRAAFIRMTLDAASKHFKQTDQREARLKDGDETEELEDIIKRFKSGGH